jgi:hypothetical protein
MCTAGGGWKVLREFSPISCDTWRIRLRVVVFFSACLICTELLQAFPPFVRSHRPFSTILVEKLARRIYRHGCGFRWHATSPIVFYTGEVLENTKKSLEFRADHRTYRWTVMTSSLSNILLQLGHFLIRFEIRSSTQPLQNMCPHVFKTVSLKLLWHTEQVASFC